MVLESRCNGKSCGAISTYHWSLFAGEIGRSNNSWIEIKGLKDLILTDVDSPDLVLTGKTSDSNHSLQNDKLYKAVLTAELDEGIKIQGEHQFETNSPPRLRSGQKGCHVNPEHGAATVTEFVISCGGFYDDHLPLGYQFSYFSSLGGQIVLQSGESTSVTTTLPLGDVKRSYAVALNVQIFDAFGDFVQETLKVKVNKQTNNSHIIRQFLKPDAPSIA